MRVDAARLRAAAGVVRDAAAGARALGRRGVPVGRPLPHVARHVGQAEAVGRERAHRASFGRSPRSARHGKSPCHQLASRSPGCSGPLAPHVRAPRRGRRARRAPTRPRSAAPAPPTPRRPRRPRRRRARRGGRRGRRATSAGPSGRRQHAPGVHVHHWLRWRRSTGPGVGVKTREPGREVLRRRAGEVRRVERALGHRHVAGGGDERRERAVRDRRAVDRRSASTATSRAGPSSG